MGSSINFIPKFSAKVFASDLLSPEVILDGIETPRMLSLPSASHKIVAQTVESSPPDKPKTARFKPKAEK